MNRPLRVVVSVIERASKGRGVERRQVLVFASGGDWQEVAHPHQVVGGGREGKHPTDPVGTTMPGLAQTADGLDPTEDLFHPFALDLTDGVTQIVRRQNLLDKLAMDLR